MSVEKRNGRYCVRWRDSTGQQRSKTVTLWRDADKLDREMRRQKEMGEMTVHERGKETLAEFWPIWWQNYGQVHLTPRSRAVYERLYSRHLRTLHNRKLRDIRSEHLVELTTSLGRTLSPSTVRKVLAVLQCVLQRATEWGYLMKNPAAGMKRPRAVTRRARVLSQDELDALCAELDLRSSAVVRLLAYTALRPGELRALHWDDVTKTVLHVRYAASSDVIGPTKTGKTRVVTLNDAARKTLIEWFMASGQPSPRDLVFPGRSGKLWTDYGWNHWQQETFTAAARRAGIKGVVPYDLRHTAISAMIACGLDPIRVARMAGNSATMALQTYAHEFESVYSEGNADQPMWEIPRKREGFGN